MLWSNYFFLPFCSFWCLLLFLFCFFLTRLYVVRFGLYVRLHACVKNLHLCLCFLCVLLWTLHFHSCLKLYLCSWLFMCIFALYWKKNMTFVSFWFSFSLVVYCFELKTNVVSFWFSLGLVVYCFGLKTNVTLVWLSFLFSLVLFNFFYIQLWNCDFVFLFPGLYLVFVFLSVLIDV